MSQKIIAIHQPNFIPWAGYFLKMAACDVFVFHDNVQITKAGPTRRVKISAHHTQDHTQWLTVPLKKHSDFTLIKDLEVSWESDWTKKHLNLIKDSYKGSLFFDMYFPVICEWYQNAKDFNSLSQMNIYFLKQIMNELGISKEIFCSSQLPVSGKASTFNLAITQYLNGTHYLSGAGGDKYQEEQLFLLSQIKLESIDAKIALASIFPGFNINFSVSILELLMKVDLQTIKSGFFKNK